ncbi:helix-turn-helix transcriptional regulator [Acidaminobacter sp. JC074]|uniref:winged helix-turn-helix transcriptional regulator n=1 Tax=Acidaminobacter sp. JC074 TaxID=2530199 RepID=UPI001F1164C7|nr:helix-turn-helix domain-containing protein [Acidaminobacter sp. JC074]MCH4890189.1 helix-turn-helix transcriptional regulator [Acidaminobacter sp. JC074]
MKIRKEITCPLEITHDIIKGKWKTVILYQINHIEKASLSQLESSIKGISQKMLLEQLKELMSYGLVGKNTFQGYPLRVEYYITEDRGKKLIEALDIMQEIGVKYLEDQGTTEG